MKKFLWVVAVLFVIGVINAALSDDGDSEQKQGTAKESNSESQQGSVKKGVVKKNARYQLPDDIIDAAERGGYECGERTSGTTLDFFATECETGDFFTTQLDPESLAQFRVNAEGSVLFGPNWTVECWTDCGILPDILGGKLESF